MIDCRRASWICVLSSVALGALGARAQGTAQPAYLNPELPAAVRAADLVHRLTLEEKASQLVNQSRAIARLGVPAYDWWSESLHGVAVSEAGEIIIAQGQYGLSIGGGQPGTGAPAVSGRFEVQGQMALPE